MTTISPAAALWHLHLPWARPPIIANDSTSRRQSMHVVASTRDDVAQVARSLKIPAVTVPVVALLTWYRGSNRVADSDNIAPTLKRCLDGLRLAGVLVDDTPRQVVMTMQRVVLRDYSPWSDGQGRVVLSLFPAEAWPVDMVAPSRSATLTLGEPAP